ncbi:unnamed protein product [Cuscuta campestris]|uniref:Uncharacterized protein n=1 Tax=Cuscuta campestris TaxID=132261 RepID=A0A484KN20_9ASTE|nr:unnamed protein product [Cuscuta campestris]
MERFSDMELERESDGEDGGGDCSPLSFRYLEIENGKEDRQPGTPSPPQDVFYFFSDFPAVEKHRMSDSAVEINGTQKWDYFRSHSFSGKRESSGSGSERSRSDSRKVNISSLTTMSAASRRRMFMFGPVRFQPEMDLVAIRERQRRRLSPKRVLPSAAADEGVVEKAGVGRRSERRGAGSRLWAAVAKRLSCFKVESVAD